MLDVQRQSLTIPRGAKFRAVGWVVTDPESGEPLRSTEQIVVAAKVRAHSAASQVLHEFACSAVLMVLPDQYGALPVVVAQIDEMAPEETAALTWDRGVYDVVVNGEVKAAGRVRAPLVVSR